MPTLEEIQTEVKQEEDAVKAALTPSGRGELIYVNGRRYQGQVIFDRRKGVGWENGRTASVQLSDVPEDAEVILVDLRFGRLRRCIRNQRPAYTGSNLGGDRVFGYDWDAAD